MTTEQAGKYKINYEAGRANRPTQEVLKCILAGGDITVPDYKFLLDILAMAPYNFRAESERWSHVVEDSSLNRYYIYFDAVAGWTRGTPLDLRKKMSMYGEIEKQAIRGLILLEEQMQEKLRSAIGDTQGN